MYEAKNIVRLLQRSVGERVSVVGSIKPNHKTNKHKFKVKGGAVSIVGDINKLNAGNIQSTTKIKAVLRVGSRRVLGLCHPHYEMISYKCI